MIDEVSQEKKRQNDVLCTVLNQRCRKSNGGHSDTDGVLVSKADRVSVCSDEEMDGWW